MKLWFATIVALILGAASANGADTLIAVFGQMDDGVKLEYFSATCADNPECEAGSVSCDGSGLTLDLFAVEDGDAGYLLRDGNGVRLKAGKQSAVVLPTSLGFDELNGGWDITFGGWRSRGEETDELVDAMKQAPLEIVNVAKTMDLDLPTGSSGMSQQKQFAEACIGLR